MFNKNRTWFKVASVLLILFMLLFTGTSLSVVTAKTSSLAQVATEKGNNKEKVKPNQPPAVLSQNENDTYPYWNDTIDAQDPWLFLKRECTSYVAWKINESLGITDPNATYQYFHNYMSGPSGSGTTTNRWSDAGKWKKRALEIGFNYSTTPAPGAIAFWQSGHVAYVEAVAGNNIAITEYNSPAGSFTFRERTIAASDPNGYIYAHMNSLQGEVRDLGGNLVNAEIEVQTGGQTFLRTATNGVFNIAEIKTGPAVVIARNGDLVTQIDFLLKPIVANNASLTLPNNPPTVAAIPGQTINEDQAFAPINLASYVTDPDTNEVFTWSVSGNTNIQVNIQNNMATLNFTDWYGEETVTFTVKDKVGSSASTSAVFKALDVTGRWVTGNPTSEVKRYPSLTKLNDGKVLQAGGYTAGQSRTSSQVFDPSTGQWTDTVGGLNVGRMGHTDTLLSDGRVLVVGGYNPNYGSGGYVASAEIFNPQTGEWALTNGGLATGRYSHTASLLPDGRVLIVGGFAEGTYGAPSEIYDPQTNSWSTQVASPSVGRGQHTATTLQNGKIMIAGGYNPNVLNSVEIYDPSAGTWSAGLPMIQTRTRHTATLLPDGRVLVAGGWRGDMIASAEIYNPGSGPGTDYWHQIVNMNFTRSDHTAELVDGKVMVISGAINNGVPFNSVEVYDVANQIWTVAPSLQQGRVLHKSVRLSANRVLVVGGNIGGENDTASTEVLMYY